MRITSNNIQSLRENEIFVFGSNLSGMHGGGAAYIAHQKFGAIYGQGIGLQGQSYAIPTKDYYIRRTLFVKEIKLYVDDFISFAKNNSQLKFLVTEIGCGLANLTPEQIAPLFKEAINIENIYLPINFIKIINNEHF